MTSLRHSKNLAQLLSSFALLDSGNGPSATDPDTHIAPSVAAQDKQQQNTLSEALSPNSTIAQYTIVSKIGAGDMGEVYLAQDASVVLNSFEEDRSAVPKLISRERN